MLRESQAHDDPYPELREILAPEWADLPAEELESLLEGVSAEDLESFLGGLKRFARKAAPFVQKALPVVGTVAGTAIGGPLGAAVGGLAGRAAAGAVGAAAAPHPRGRRGRPAGPRRGRAVPRLPAGGSPAAAQLLQLLSRPQALQAIAGMALGGAGRRQVRVGSSPVPLGAFTNLLGVLANQAAAEYHAAIAGEAAGIPTYLLDDAGEFLVDPAEPEERAQALLARFAEEDAMEAAAEDDGEEEDAAEDEALWAAAELAEIAAWYDEIEAAEDDEGDEEDDGVWAEDDETWSEDEDAWDEAEVWV